VRCAESLRVQAYFDAEVDAISAADVERHLEHCAECRALLQDLEHLRGALRGNLPYERTPAPLRAKLMSALDEEAAAPAAPDILAPPGGLARPGPTRRMAKRARSSFWLGALGGAGATALAAILAFFLLVPSPTDPVSEQLVNAHLRSLLPDHLIDVVSTDKHTVKPWFSGHADVSPVVMDFEAQGYRLIGGRADYLDHQRSAVIVYRHGAHIINVFSWAGGERALPVDVTRDGYHLAFWKAGDLYYCAVSDTGWDELHNLVRLLRE